MGALGRHELERSLSPPTPRSRDNETVGDVERDLRDRAEDSLAELDRLEVHRLFSGFGFYLDGLLVAAAWNGAFRLRHREDGHWVYKAVEDSVVDDPAALAALVRGRAEELSKDPLARRRR